MPKSLQDRWLAIGLKRMIRYAADNGYDKIAWTTGEQQVQRYENALRKQVDSIEWEKTPEGVHIKGYKMESAWQPEYGRLIVSSRGDGTYGVWSDEQNFPVFEAPTRAEADAWVENYESGDAQEKVEVANTRYAENDLTEALGKVMADRIRNDPSQTGVIEGDNLTVDSVGVKKLYDVGVPAQANKILKEMGGGRVGEVDLTMPWSLERGSEYLEKNGVLPEGPDNLKQPSFDITPALRERAMQGMPRFSVAPTISRNIVKNNEGYWVYKGELPESFYRWFGKSVVTDKDGYPRVMFHGTARDITEFKQKQANAIFITDDEEFAGDFSAMSFDWMRSHIDQFVTPELQKELAAKAKKIRAADKSKIEYEEFQRLLLDELPSGKNIMPLFVRAEKPFDYSDTTHLAAVRKELEKSLDFSKQEIDLVLDTVKKGSWAAIERDEVQDAIRAAGFDGFYAKEAGRVNLAVYDANQVKSVTGNSGEYSRESKDIRRSVAPKLAKDTGAAYASNKEVKAVRSILPVHPDWVDHLDEKFSWDDKATGDYKNDRKVFKEGNKKLVIGRITPQDWIDRVELMLKPQERVDSRNWYKNIKLEFQKKFGDEWPKYMVSYLLGNKAESPRGALNNTLYVAEEIKTMTSGTRTGGLSDEQMRQIFKGDPVSLVGIGAKLYDFVDSALGKTTRAWMGNTIEGNSPFVVDRHTFRDSGRVDPALLSYIQENFGENAARGIVLDSPTTGSVSSPQYEKITTWGNELTENLNNLKYLGGNWTPLEVQAVGWMAMSRLTETAAGGTTEGAFDAMTKTLPVELDFGAGAPYNIKFKDWHDLSSEAKSRVTYKAMREVADVVAEFTGTKVRDFTEGVGGWGSYVNPNAVIRFLASDQTAEALSAMAAYLGHQTKVLAFHPANAQTGDSVAFDIAPVGNTPFTNKDISEKIWPELFKSLDPVMGRDADGDPKIGFVQAKTSDGRPTIRILVSLPTGVFSSGPKKGSLKNIRDLSVSERNISEKSLLDNIKPVIEAAIKNIAGNYSFDYGRVKVVSSTNNWKEQKNGDSHRQRVEKRFGSVLQGRLDAVGVPRVESAIQKAIDEERQPSGEKLSIAPRLEGQEKQSVAPRLTVSPYISATGVLGGRAIPTTFAAPASSKLTDHIYTWADKFVDLKNLQAEIEKTTGQLDDQYNAYQKEELYHAKVAKQVLDFMRQEVRPLFDAMEKENITPEKLNEYLHSRHAKERNDQIDKINQGVVQGIVGKGSGITTKDARDYLNSLSAQEKASLDRVAKMLDGIMQKTRDLMVSSGLEEQGTIDAWQKTYKHYVPLERVLGDPDEENTGFTGQGQGYSVSKNVKRALGSTLDVEHIIANILATRERTIVRAEKNEVNKAIYGLAIKAPNPNIWIAVDPELPKNTRKNLASFLATFGGFTLNEAQNIAAYPQTRSVDRQTGLIIKGRNPQLAKADNVLHLMIDGKEKLVFFNSRNKQANRLVRTLKNLDTATVARGLQTVAVITRYFSAVNTQYNPIFGVINLIRDVQTGLINLQSTPIAGMQKQVANDFMPAIKGIWSQLRAEAKGGNGTGQWAALFKEFEQYGGPTGYRDMFANSDDRAKMIESEIKSLKQGKIKEGFSGLKSMLSDYNTAFENGVRLAAYKAALDKGLSKEKAASLAKNLTVNFNRKGDIALQAGALYAFFNASVQGTARILQTMTRIENGKLVITPLGNKIIRGGLLLGVVQAVALAAAGFDDDNPPQFVREKNIIIPLMNGKYLTIPMPLGFNLLPNLSRNVTEWGMSGFKNTPKRIISLLESVMTGLNPFGGGFSVQTLVPTVVDPLIALAENKDSFGRKIAREDFSDLRQTPGYLRTKDTATPWSKGLSEFLNYASGGTKYMKGALSPTPDQIDYLIGQATGGVGREIGKISQTISSTATGEELPSTKIPLLSRFYGDTEESASQSNKYYTNLSRINSYAAEIKGRIGHPGTGTVSEFIQDVPEARLVPLATATYSAIQKIEKLKKQAIERGLPKERIRQFEKLTQDRMKQFNQRVEAFQR